MSTSHYHTFFTRFSIIYAMDLCILFSIRISNQIQEMYVMHYFCYHHSHPLQIIFVSFCHCSLETRQNVRWIILKPSNSNWTMKCSSFEFINKKHFRCILHILRLFYIHIICISITSKYSKQSIACEKFHMLCVCKCMKYWYLVI